MAIHRIDKTQILPGTLDRAWSFFSDPRNLASITPPDLGFEIVNELPPEIYAGLMIEYRVRPLFGLPVTWLTEITHVGKPFSFVDEQRIGPYRIWHHEHRFRDLGDGRVEARDIVCYVPPFGPLGEIVHPALIAPRLRAIFDYREKVLPGFFPGA